MAVCAATIALTGPVLAQQSPSPPPVQAAPAISLPTVTVDLPHGQLTAYVAREARDIAGTLRCRRDVPRGFALLSVYDGSVVTLGGASYFLSVDEAAIDERGLVVAVWSRVPQLGATIGPALHVRARYVVTVPAGGAEQAGLTPGASVTLPWSNTILQPLRQVRPLLVPCPTGTNPP